MSIVVYNGLAVVSGYHNRQHRFKLPSFSLEKEGNTEEPFNDGDDLVYNALSARNSFGIVTFHC